MLDKFCELRVCQNCAQIVQNEEKSHKSYTRSISCVILLHCGRALRNFGKTHRSANFIGSGSPTSAGRRLLMRPISHMPTTFHSVRDLFWQDLFWQEIVLISLKFASLAKFVLLFGQISLKFAKLYRKSPNIIQHLAKLINFSEIHQISCQNCQNGSCQNRSRTLW